MASGRLPPPPAAAARRTVHWQPAATGLRGTGPPGGAGW